MKKLLFVSMLMLSCATKPDANVSPVRELCDTICEGHGMTMVCGVKGRGIFCGCEDGFWAAFANKDLPDEDCR